MHFQFMIVFINVYRHFHLVMMAGEEIDYFRLVMTPSKPQGCPTHCSVKRDHDALNEGCTCAVCTCVEKQTSSVNIFCKHMCASSRHPWTQHV